MSPRNIDRDHEKGLDCMWYRMPSDDESQERSERTSAAGCDLRQAAERSARKLHDVESYFEMRRENAGVKPCFALVLLERNVELPDEVLDHPAIVELELWAVDMVILCNVRRSLRQ